MTDQPDPKAVAAEALRRLLAVLADAGEPLRVVEVAGGRAALLLVWDAAAPMPAVAADRRRRSRQGRDGCRADVLAAVRAAGVPLTRKEVVTAVRRAGHAHEPGTVAKALADLTAAGGLANSRDKKGYRLPGWVRPRLTLFDAG